MTFIGSSAKTNWKFIGIIAILTVFIGGGILFYSLSKPKADISQITPPQVVDIVKPDDVTEDETTDWLTYTNEEFGFEVRYPESLVPLAKTSGNGISFWFSSDKGIRFANYEFFARQEDFCEVSAKSSSNVLLAENQFTKGIHMLSETVENPEKDGIVGIQYVGEHRSICYQLNYWERIQNGVRYSSYAIDEMGRFITQFGHMISKFRLRD